MKTYADFLREKYGEKVYKLPVNLPVSCPNRMDGRGCSFCSDLGTGFEAISSCTPVKEQLAATRTLIEKKYNAHKFIAYFQNYTNTFLPIDRFRGYLKEAAEEKDVVAISVSTRPDCVREDYLQVMKDVQEKYGIDICVELGLQTVNYHTLDGVNRGHGLGEFIDAVLQIKKWGFLICTHVILNLPGDELRDAVETAKVLSALRVDIVKLHSLYIAKNTALSEDYKSGKIKVCSKEEYFRRVIAFVEYISPEIVIERFFSRIPEEDSLFCNWNTSWRKLQDELMEQIQREHIVQGSKCNYLKGSGLDKL